MPRIMQLLKAIVSRTTIIGILILIQFSILIFAIWKLTELFAYLYIIFTIISIFAVLRIISKNENPSYKLAWVVPILSLPVFGGFLYILFGDNKVNKLFSKKMQQSLQTQEALLSQQQSIFDEIEKEDKSIANQMHYLISYSAYPVYKNTTSQYLALGEIKWKKLLQELEKAEHFIFMEYFIIQEGKMWNSILDVLIKKVAAGVDVRIIYDDIGCLNTLPYRYDKYLESLGIRCLVFNKFVPFLSIRMNNRDHRKITVIDGYVGFTGGINLADEYINVYEKHGHWKDCAVMLKGEAVYNFTVMFLQTWDFITGKLSDYTLYAPHIYHKEAFESDGYILPFGDSPMDNEQVGSNSYLNMITRAKDYVYINSPYLIVDNETVTALCIAAKSGVDVRIVTPHVADKWYVHLVTQSYYPALIECGVKIYEYSPGFIHSKTFVTDDTLAIVGTINLDYRSLYLHFECAAMLYKTKAVLELKEDYLKTLEVCIRITPENTSFVSLPKKMLCSVIKVFAPLM